MYKRILAFFACFLFSCRFLAFYSGFGYQHVGIRNARKTREKKTHSVIRPLHFASYTHLPIPGAVHPTPLIHSPPLPVAHLCSVLLPAFVQRLPSVCPASVVRPLPATTITPTTRCNDYTQRHRAGTTVNLRVQAIAWNLTMS